ncbi:MAG TPA: PQQ-binding-like beta-propeller repeat protein [Bryobacteraceae bacterium]|nr:PQQ-binding-like beta-propeller repeat protein [Bryobacteraceae bacterium]
MSIRASVARVALLCAGLAGALQLAAQTSSGPSLPPIPPGPGGGLSPFASLPAMPTKASPLDKLTPVTDALLDDPPVSDWLIWRRTYDDVGFSPLKQIDKNNASHLRVAWTWALPAGPNEATPLVHDGVMFAFGFGDRIEALNAATGDLLWYYARELPKDARPAVKRNMVLYGDKLFFATSDGHIVALDIKTGRAIWDHEIADYKSAFRLSGGPLAAKGKVMQGVAGQGSGGNYIVGLDADTGAEAWRFYTIARPGEPGGNSWNGLPLEKRNGGSVWTAGSYDPALNIAYFGVGQTYDTGPLVHPSSDPGVTRDALYTDSTLAINPDSGKLLWYYQHVPNDQWDLDWAFERQLIPLRVNGETRKLAITSGKMAIYDALDATTGQYEFSIDLGLQNIVTAIDPKTGAKTINPKTLPGDGETKLVCPHAGGAKNWTPASYDAATQMLYVPLVESCMDLIPTKPGERSSLSSGVRWAMRPRLDSDGKYGRVMAINLATKKVAWMERERAPITTGTLATAGGVVFEGSQDRWFRARDAATGRVLWQIRLNDVPNAAPISYSVNGKQYVAMTVGNGGAIPATWAQLIPDIQNPPGGGGGAVWVFELP